MPRFDDCVVPVTSTRPVRPGYQDRDGAQVATWTPDHARRHRSGKSAPLSRDEITIHRQRIVGREDVDKASGPASVVLRGYGILVVNSRHAGELARFGPSCAP